MRCASNRLSASKVNTPALDFSCPECEQLFQLKGLKKWNPKKIVDAGYEAMVRSIRADRIPNLLILQYSREWSIENLMVIPRIFFSEARLSNARPLDPSLNVLDGWDATFF